MILASKVFAKEIRWKSWWYTLSTALLVTLLSFVTIYFQEWYVKLLAGLLLGPVLIRLFVIYHDFEHHAILLRSKVAMLFFNLFGIIILAPRSIWKRSHDYHHSHNCKLYSASIGSYPIYTRQRFEKLSDKEKRIYLFMRHPLTIFFGYPIIFVFGMCWQSFVSSPRRHWDSLVAILLHLGLNVLVFWQCGWLTWICGMLIPFFIASMLGAYLFYAQHNFPGVEFRGNSDWAYDHAALESSSFMRMGFFWRWMTANIGYHHVHHLNSRIPFYRLPEAMKMIPELQHPKETSLKPMDIIRCFRLKVWDPEKKSMTGV